MCGDAKNPPFNLGDFDFVWASPPCQHASAGTDPEWARARHPRLDSRNARDLLRGHPFTVVENVPLAGIRADCVLNGPMFGLNTDRTEKAL